MSSKKNLAIFASGNGSNFEAIVKKIKDGTLKADKGLLITNKKDCFARKRAEKYQIKDIFVDPAKYKNRAEYDQKLIEILDKEDINAVVLAGYKLILSPFFIKRFENKILNIHPSLLPRFPGNNAIARAFNSGCRVTGITVHFVDVGVDRGPIIAQEVVPIEKNMGLEELEAEIHQIEHRFYPYVLKLFLEDRLKIKGRDVKII